MYNGGIINSKSCGYNAIHKAVVVGYGIENQKAYWIVKNNWGKNWGEKGYVRITMADNAEMNGGPGVCGITTGPIVPITKRRVGETY